MCLHRLQLRTQLLVLALATGGWWPWSLSLRAQTAPSAIETTDTYPLVTTAQAAKARDFYVRHFGFRVAFESTWFVLLAAPGREATIAFMTPDHPSSPPGPQTLDGRGLVFTVQVRNARIVCDRLSAANVPRIHPLTDEPWGQRRCAVRDPAGLFVDVVEQIAPKPGYWTPYEGAIGMPRRSGARGR